MCSYRGLSPWQTPCFKDTFEAREILKSKSIKSSCFAQVNLVQYQALVSSRHSWPQTLPKSACCPFWFSVCWREEDAGYFMSLLGVREWVMKPGGIGSLLLRPSFPLPLASFLGCPSLFLLPWVDGDIRCLPLPPCSSNIQKINKIGERGSGVTSKARLKLQSGKASQKRQPVLELWRFQEQGIKATESRCDWENQGFGSWKSETKVQRN